VIGARVGIRDRVQMEGSRYAREKAKGFLPMHGLPTKDGFRVFRGLLNGPGPRAGGTIWKASTWNEAISEMLATAIFNLIFIVHYLILILCSELNSDGGISSQWPLSRQTNVME
jgi:hypothetical protein